jgi:hypothetical protein
MAEYYQDKNRLSILSGYKFKGSGDIGWRGEINI